MINRKNRAIWMVVGGFLLLNAIGFTIAMVGMATDDETPAQATTAPETVATPKKQAPSASTPIRIRVRVTATPAQEEQYTSPLLRDLELHQASWRVMHSVHPARNREKCKAAIAVSHIYMATEESDDVVDQVTVTMHSDLRELYAEEAFKRLEYGFVSVSDFARD